MSNHGDPQGKDHVVKIRAIYIDLDGVLADFDGWKNTVPGGEDDSVMWAAAAKIEHFYDTLKPMPDAHLLMEYLRGLQVPLVVLTGLPRKTTMPTAEADKHKWLKRHFGEMEFHACLAVQKQRMSGPGLILIDDKPINIEQWEAKGGKGFLYEGFLVLYDELQAYLKGSI